MAWLLCFFNIHPGSEGGHGMMGDAYVCPHCGYDAYYPVFWEQLMLKLGIWKEG